MKYIIKQIKTDSPILYYVCFDEIKEKEFNRTGKLFNVYSIKKENAAEFDTRKQVQAAIDRCRSLDDGEFEIIEEMGSCTEIDSLAKNLNALLVQKNEEYMEFIDSEVAAGNHKNPFEDEHDHAITVYGNSYNYLSNQTPDIHESLRELFETMYNMGVEV